MLHHYTEAEKIGRDSRSADTFYPAFNRLVAEFLVGYTPRMKALRGDLPLLRTMLQTRVDDDPDFWSMVGQKDLDVLDALLGERLAPALDTIEAGYRNVHSRVNMPWMWDSVCDTMELILRVYADRAADAGERSAAGKLLSTLQSLCAP